jgi:hypothetical protein
MHCPNWGLYNLSGDFRLLFKLTVCVKKMILSCMKYFQKNGTLFDLENGNIVPCRTSNPELQKLAAPSPYNPSVHRILNFKENSKNT